MKSIWQQTSLPQFPQLSGDIKTDVLIIGGGMAGLLTAYYLHQNGIEYVLLEKERLCGGNTQNTTAKITAQHGLIYSKISQSSGLETARKYLDANMVALREYSKLCEDIDCDYEVKDSLVYSGNKSKLKKEFKTLQEIGAPAELYKEIPLPIETAGAIKFSQQAQFNPLKFLAGIIGELNIYEHTWVREMIGNTAVTDSGKIAADRVVCTTHFPFINKHGSYFLKMYQHRSYVIALENAPNVDGMYADEKNSGLSFRNYQGLLLLGGGGSRTGKKSGSWGELRSFAREHYPQAKEKFFWAAQDCMSLDGIPYIGKYSAHTPNFYVATGFNKWGMTSSMLAGMIISDMLMGRENQFTDIFNPSRSILKPQLFLNGVEAIANLLTPAPKVCPHLGCALKWNRAEHSWDCPCHGSRFNEDGRVLDNPSNGNLKVNN